MIPQFPQFRPLTSVAYPHIENAVRRFGPYSDFNANCIWSWDTDEKLQICALAGNIAIRFSDYSDETFFYSFVGDNDLDFTAAALLRRSMVEQLDPALYLVPESVASRLDPAIFDIQEDPDQFDYVLSVDALCAFEGRQFASKRTELRKFLRRFENPVFQIIDFDDPRTFQYCRGLFRSWQKTKHEKAGLDSNREFEAFKRCIRSRDQSKLFGAGVYVDDALRAFSVCEIGEDGYAFIHFEKADTAGFPGLSVYLAQQIAAELARRGIKYINIEQDLGVPGLRANKLSYAPCKILKKYTVRLSATQQSAGLRVGCATAAA